MSAMNGLAWSNLIVRSLFDRLEKVGFSAYPRQPRLSGSSSTAVVRTTVQDGSLLALAGGPHSKKFRSERDIASVATQLCPVSGFAPTNIWLKPGKAATNIG